MFTQGLGQLQVTTGFGIQNHKIAQAISAEAELGSIHRLLRFCQVFEERARSTGCPGHIRDSQSIQTGYIKAAFDGFGRTTGFVIPIGDGCDVFTKSGRHSPIF